MNYQSVQNLYNKYMSQYLSFTFINKSFLIFLLTHFTYISKGNKLIPLGFLKSYI